MERDAEAIWPGVLRVGLRRLDSGIDVCVTDLQLMRSCEPS